MDEQNFNLTLSTWDLDTIGDYDISFEVALEDFPSVTSTASFTARIRFCFLDRLIAPPITPRLYQVSDEKLEITWTDFI